MDTVLKTPRLWLRKIRAGDFPQLLALLGDPGVMYAWDHGFDKAEVRNWMAKTLARYDADGFGHYAVIHKESKTFLGVCGPMTEWVDGRREVGLGYIFAAIHWGRGYATESAAACMDYAFNELKANKVIAEILPENLPSRRLAERLGMTITGRFTKEYRGKRLPHLIYSRTN